MIYTAILINFTNRRDLISLYDYFEKAYGLPQSVTKQKIRQDLGRSYLFKQQKFKSRLRIRNIPRYIALYGGLIYALFFATRKSETKTYLSQLIIYKLHLNSLGFRNY